MLELRPWVSLQALSDAVNLGGRALVSVVIVLIGWSLMLTVAVPLLTLYTAVDAFIDYAGRHQTRLTTVYWLTWKTRRALETAQRNGITDDEELADIQRRVMLRYQGRLPNG